MAVPDGDPAKLVTATATLTALVGLIPPGLPSLTMPDPALIEQLLPGAFGIALMSFTETIAAGRAFARPEDPPIDANRERIATGPGNLGGALFGAMPANGGTLKRTLRMPDFRDYALGLDKRVSLSISGAERRIQVELMDGYTHAQVFAPSGQGYIVIEPMTAPPNARDSGDGLQVVKQGGSCHAVFRIGIQAARGAM